ncbi:helix-turn-helix transcriptional regulator [Aquabacterium sp. J223]|uniref:helix-turn-helix transcriptional regulator n=1 Tax=Aquabacterium sp. J223 TaxID=2898431 RepID=UPI0021ADAA91|nr:WYL domain-containing protein [Aquabacterium sp. J223]UUX94777.1 WYL domain-containing protein [Aquabacterium sp. J223]
MDRTERFYKIERLIRSRRPGEPLVSFVEMMDELGVSRATLKRDLEYLRSRLDAPIVYDRYGNGYRFESDPRDRAGDTQHELPGVWFSERELHALLSMHHLIRDLDEGGVLGRHLQPLLDKLQGLLGDEAEARELMKRIRIASPARRPVPARHFELLGSALVQRRRVHLGYYTRSRRQRSVRTVSPQRLVHWRNTWYLDAWCHDSDGLRRFALDAVEEATLLDQKAKEVSLKTVQEQLDAGYGVFSGAALHWAELLFSAEAAQWVAQEQWHPAQEGERLADGRWRLRLPYAEPTELLMDVLRHGADVEVVSPASLRRQVRERLRGAVSLYEG